MACESTTAASRGHPEEGPWRPAGRAQKSGGDRRLERPAAERHCTVAYDAIAATVALGSVGFEAEPGK